MIPTVTVDAMLRLLQASPEQCAALQAFMETLGTGTGGQAGAEVRLVWGGGRESGQVGTGESGKGSNIEHSTFNAQHSMEDGEESGAYGTARPASEEVARSAFAVLTTAGVARKGGSAKLPAPTTQSLSPVEPKQADTDVIHRVGRLAYRNDFADVWLGEEHFDLSRRAKARACLRFLVEQRAFDTKAARDLIHEIDPYVRAQCQLPELPGYGELKIHHYFNPSKSDVARLGRELVRPAGRNGRYFLNVN